MNIDVKKTFQPLILHGLGRAAWLAMFHSAPVDICMAKVPTPRIDDFITDVSIEGTSDRPLSIRHNSIGRNLHPIKRHGSAAGAASTMLSPSTV